MGASILVVDDNEDNLALMKMLLTRLGHEPFFAASGPDGITAAREHHPDLILMDLDMPGMDGRETADLIRADPSFGGQPIIAVTAGALAGNHEAALQAGFDGYLSKPILPAALSGQIDPFLPPDRRSAPLGGDAL